MSPAPRPSAPALPRVVIIDADRRVQQSLTDLLGVNGEIDVVGACGDVRSALELVERERPAAVLVDPRLPDIEAGLALIAGMQRAWPSVRVVMTGWSDTIGHGGLGELPAYVSKSASPEEFAAAIADACTDP